MSAETKDAVESVAGQTEPVSGMVEKPGAAPKAKRAGIYTINAQQGFDVSELVNAAFGRKSMGKQTPRKLELFAPDGPSTAGGKRARQTIRLVPLAGDTGPLMCGFVDVAQKVVELRGYDTLAEQFEARFGTPCDITPEEYATLCRELQMVLTPFRYTFSLESKPAAAVRAALTSSGSEPAASKSTKLTAVLMGVLVLVAAAAALIILR